MQEISLATGVTAAVAIDALRRHRPRRTLLAVPVCSPDTARTLEDLADEVVCPLRPDDFRAVGRWYDCFAQTSDDEVLACLQGALHSSDAAGPKGERW